MAPREAILLLGAPLSGKGTLASALTAAHPDCLEQWESSSLLKAYAATHDDERSAAINEIFSGGTIKSAKLLNDDDLVAVIAQHARNTPPHRIPLLDGVIRTPQQAGALKSVLDVTLALYLDHDNLTIGDIKRRVKKRNRPGETVKQAFERIVVYEEKTASLTERFAPVLVRIDASLSIEDVYKKAHKAIQRRFKL